MIPRHRRHPKRDDLKKVPTEAGKREYRRLIEEEDKLPIGAEQTVFDRRNQGPSGFGSTSRWPLMPNRCAPTYYHRLARQEKQSAQKLAYALLLIASLAIGAVLGMDRDNTPKPQPHATQIATHTDRHA